MEEKFIPIDDTEEKANQIIPLKNQNSPEIKYEFPGYIQLSNGKRKVKRININSPKDKKIDKIISENIPSFQFLSLVDKKKSSSNKYEDYEIIDMSEKDKKLMYCYNYLRNITGLEENQNLIINDLNQKINININIIQKEPYLLLYIDKEKYTFEDFAREIMFVNDEAKTITNIYI